MMKKIKWKEIVLEISTQINYTKIKVNIQNSVFPNYYTTFFILYAIGVIYAYDFCSRNDVLLTEYHCPALCPTISHWEHKVGRWEQLFNRNWQM